MTTRGPLTLAALASAAVPGLDPDSVEAVLPSGPTDAMEVAFIQDREHRRWVIRSPRTPAASAQLEQSAALLALLARRLTMPVPAVKGWVALPEGGRAAVHSYLTGRLVDLPAIAPGSALATGLGRVLAQLHNLDPRVYEEAGVPVYDASSYRSRRLADLDRAAATGRVPTGLLTRWEQVLDDLSSWTFTATPTHGAVGPRTVLATPDNGEEPDIKALLGWESAQVADPADDLATLVGELTPEAFDTVLEAYAHSRVERPDPHLQERARLVSEMQLVRSMMAAVAVDDHVEAEKCAARLRRLDDRLAREEEAAERAAAEEARRTSQRPTEDAVQVEHPAAPVPVRPPAETPGKGSADRPAETSGKGSADRPAETSGKVSADRPAETPGTEGAGRRSDSAPRLAVVDESSGNEPSGDEPEAPDRPVATGPARDRPETEGPRPGSGEPGTDELPVARPKQGNDHTTAEITPIGDDGDEDVVPLKRRP